MEGGIYDIIRARLQVFADNPDLTSADAVAGQIALRIDEIIGSDGPLRPIYEEFAVESKEAAEMVIARFPTYGAHMQVVYCGRSDVRVGLTFNLCELPYRSK